MSATKRRRALAFAGGGLDAVMQMGVAHALLVSRGAPPDFVVGVSSGAINAAALAEILLAGPPALPAEIRRAIAYEDRLPFQVDTLRQFINTYLAVPDLVAQALIPDSLEVMARDPLKPLELPIHFESERDAREVANEAKAGWVYLLNDLFGFRVTVATATRIIRRVLGIIEAPERPNRFVAFGARLKNEFGLVLTVWRHFFELAPVVGTALWALIIGPNRAALRGGQSSATADKLMKTRGLLDYLWVPLRRLLVLYMMAHLFLLASAGTIASWPLRLMMTIWKGGDRFARWLKDLQSAATTRVLSYYGLADGLANSDVIKQMLVKCFDVQYYGETQMSDVLDRSLSHDSNPAAATDLVRKRLSEYEKTVPPIKVAVVAARVDDGELHAFGEQVPVVDALLAATAAIPFLPAVKIDEEWESRRAEEAIRHEQFIKAARDAREREWLEATAECDKARIAGTPIPRFDPREKSPDKAAPPERNYGGEYFINGANVSNEAIGPLLNQIRHALEANTDDSSCVDIYPVSNLPVSKPTLPSSEKFDGILSVLPRALQLKRFRDATVEQRLTDLYSRALPRDKSWYRADGQVFVNANILPLELERPVEINQRLLTGRNLGPFEELIYETIADGCRASLEGMLPSLIRSTANDANVIPCAKVIEKRLGSDKNLPGRSAEFGPGISEVCSRCALVRGKNDSEWRDRATLRVRARDSWPEWPKLHGDQLIEVADLKSDPPQDEAVVLAGWPLRRNGVDGSQRALVSLLFGGGVFRGVFHMGVMAALKEVGIYPDVVAGSSVGSIVAAMIAQAFSNPVEQARQIAHLAGTFLSIDKLILTDRLADFVRRLTLRAAETSFSARDLDLLFRRYDSGDASAFSGRLRSIAAGIERLAHISPFELLELTRDLRMQDYAGFMATIRDDVQDFLDRGGVGDEILGSEPLSLLITQHVLNGRRSPDQMKDDLFESFRSRGIYFLATATNLEQGVLEILGDVADDESRQSPSLLYGLLASSAFPAVFRPRLSWEIFRRTNHMHQYIDGGVIDNLPLDAVAGFLDRASRGKNAAVARRPRAPHLIFTASLEVDRPRNGNPFVADDCLAVWKRSRTFRYNRKIDAFATTQEDLRTIYAQRLKDEKKVPDDALLDLHVMAVKPKWMCSTFGFHPMLGFRREKQARSIAHGCASTLGSIYQMLHQEANGEAWLTEWGVKVDQLDFNSKAFQPVDEYGNTVDKPAAATSFRLDPARVSKPGTCWFREKAPCPFAQTSLASIVRRGKAAEIGQIYAMCSESASHRARA